MPAVRSTCASSQDPADSQVSEVKLLKQRGAILVASMCVFPVLAGSEYT